MFGINLFGPILYDFGLSNSCRALALSLKKLQFPLNIINFNNNDKKVNQSYEYILQNDNNIYNINIFYFNADQINILYNNYSKYLNGYNIMVWAWELDTIPEIYTRYLNHIDEIWTISDFCLNAITKKLLIPVFNFKPPIYLHEKINLQNKSFNHIESMKNNEKLKCFLYIFDFKSDIFRKNVFQMINIFNNLKNKDKILVIIKTLNYNNESLSQMMNFKNIIINDCISNDKLYELFNITDFYISPHSYEGQGRTIMEAMKLKKPCIVTGYSGNLDFCNINNSILLKYKECEMNKNSHYKKFTDKTIKLDEEYAIKIIDDIIDNKINFKNIIDNAYNYINTYFSLDACSNLIFNRIKDILYHNQIKNFNLYDNCFCLDYDNFLTFNNDIKSSHIAHNCLNYNSVMKLYNERYHKEPRFIPKKINFNKINLNFIDKKDIININYINNTNFNSLLELQKFLIESKPEIFIFSFKLF